MQFRLHQQRETLNTPIGEDAAPYLSDDLLMVADGLGGTGGFIHTKIVPEVFDREKIFSTLYKKMYDVESDETPEFLKEHLENLYGDHIFKISYDKYLENLKKNGRTSGYFASRMLTGLILCELNYNKDLKKEIIFDKLTSAKDNLRDIEKEYEELFHQIIAEKYPKVAKNAGLKVESIVNNNPLLPSTLSMVFYDEHDDYVDTLFVWAGDSRAYTLNLLGNDNSTGLSQITEDDEFNETMNNCVYANLPFKINCKYLRLPKPCILFTCSDGCFDTFTNSVCFEWYLLDLFKNQSSTEDFKKALHDTYSNYAPDDSSTMAFKSFGYEIPENAEDDYQTIKDKALIRIEQFEKDYLGDVNDFFTANYKSEFNEINQKIHKVFVECQNYIDRNPSIKEFVYKYIKEKKITEMIKESSQKVDLLKNQKADKMKVIKDELIVVLTNQWAKMRKIVLEQTPEDDTKSLIDVSKDREIKDLEKDIAKYQINCQEESGKCLEAINKKIEKIKGTIEDITSLASTPSEEYETKFTKLKEEYGNNQFIETIELIEVSSFVASSFTDINKPFYNLKNKQKELLRKKADIARNESRLIQYACNNILDKKINIEKAPEEVINAVNLCFNKINEFDLASKNDIIVIENEIETIVKRYWYSNYQTIILDLQNEDIIRNDEFIKSKISQYGNLSISKESISDKLQKHSNVITKYNLNYEKYMRKSEVK